MNVKMNAELKAKWLQALRSGDYQQGGGCLRDPSHNTYCCLGVLCDISQVGEWDKPERDDDEEDCEWQQYQAGNDSQAYLPPKTVLEAAGLNKENANKLTEMNDGTKKYRKRSFLEIANWIEANL